MADELAVFQDRIRKVWHEDEWWFSVVDVVEVLTDSPRPSKYWTDMKQRIQDEGFIELSAKCKQMKLPAADAKQRTSDMADEETIRHIMQFIPRRKRKLHNRGYVYAIQASSGGLVKLGYARKLERRLGQLQNMCPVPLVIVWSHPGTVDDGQYYTTGTPVTGNMESGLTLIELI
jgi:hypothetical protein